MMLTWTTAVLCALALPSTLEDAPDVETKARLYRFDEVQNRLDDPKLRVLDVRSKDEFEQGHIPGAVSVDFRAASSLAGKPGGLSDRDAWADWIEHLGLEPEHEVVVMGDNRQLDAARTWWLLTYLGVENVGLANGDLSLWKDEERPWTTEPTNVAAKPFPVSLQRERLATKEDVQKAIQDQSAQIVDARSLQEYTGEVARSQRGGHIPSACHMEWNTLVDEQGRFLPVSTLREKLLGSGVDLDQAAISHCQGGGRASVDAFVLEHIGLPTRNYYLGWSDWGNAEDTPVEQATDTEGSEN